jgi:hypothetical protein
MHRDLIHTDTKDGFRIAYYACEESLSPGDALLDAEACRQIDDGTFCWFMAEVTASKNGIELGTDYLGGCCYESPHEFISHSGYYPDMVDRAITEAKEVIARLHPATAELKDSLGNLLAAINRLFATNRFNDALVYAFGNDDDAVNKAIQQRKNARAALANAI